MKYLKLFEDNKGYKRPKIGDYVICTDYTKIEPDEKLFIENNIGQIISIDIAENPYKVKFKNIPKEYKTGRISTGNIKVLSGLPYNTFISPSFLENNCRYFNSKEILYFSSNKEDLKIIISAKKYNL
jgi:hypothetical protein